MTLESLVLPSLKRSWPSGPNPTSLRTSDLGQQAWSGGSTGSDSGPRRPFRRPVHASRWTALSSAALYLSSTLSSPMVRQRVGAGSLLDNCNNIEEWNGYVFNGYRGITPVQSDVKR